MFHTFIKIRISILVSFFFILISCKQRNYNDDSKSKGFFDFLNGGQEFDSEVVGKRKCNAKYTSEHKFIGPKAPSRVYHWTDDDTALTNPHDYLSRLVKASNEANLKMKMGDNGLISNANGNAGSGLYVASNPIATYVFGKNLVSFEVNPNSKFNRLIYPDSRIVSYPKDAYEAIISNCDGLLYPYGSRSITANDKQGIAMVLWDLGNIDPKSVLAFGSKSKVDTKKDFFVEDILKNRGQSILILYSEQIIPKNIQNIEKLIEIRKYWEAQPSLYDWE